MLIDVLNSLFASELADERFVLDGKIDDGKAGEVWRIDRELHDVEGSFNRGVYLVHNENDPNRSTKIMKTLPYPLNISASLSESSRFSGLCSTTTLSSSSMVAHRRAYTTRHG